MIKHYTYAAREAAGSRVAGRIVALNAEEALSALQETGVCVTSIEPVPLGREKGISGRVVLSVRERSVLLECWVCLLNSGFSMDATLTTLQTSVSHPSVRRSLQEIQRLIREGMRLSEAVDAGGLFPPSWAVLLEAVESRGGFIEPLLALHKHGEQIRKMFQGVISSLLMPAVLIGLVFMWMWVFATWLLPVMAQTVVDLTGMSSPFFVGLKGLAALMFPSFVCVATLLCFLVLAVLRGNRANEVMGTLLAQVPAGFPLVGPLISKVHLIIVSSELRLQMEAGIPILTALTTLSRSMPHRALRGELAGVYRQIFSGTPVWQALGGLRMMPPNALALLAAGEASSKLPELLGVLVREAGLDLETEAYRLAIKIRSCAVVLASLIVGLMTTSMTIILSSAFDGITQVATISTVQTLYGTP